MARPFRLARSSAFLGIAHLTEAALPFVRNVTIARLMEPREFALSLTLSTIVAIVELVTDVGIPQLAVKLDARAVRARNTLHTIAAGRAIGVGLIVALLAEPLARLFGAPGAAWAFALTGLSIAVKGFANLGVKQMGRDYRFGAEAIVIVVSQVIWTTAVVVLSFIWSDHRAMVAGLLFYSAGFVIGSQFLSPVRYGLAWDKAVVTEAMRFGRPLVPNGIALAITSLGDRIAVGSKLSLEALALYGPLTTTAILPRGVALRYVNNLFLPAMVRTVDRCDFSDGCVFWSRLHVRRRARHSSRVWRTLHAHAASYEPDGHAPGLSHSRHLSGAFGGRNQSHLVYRGVIVRLRRLFVSGNAQPVYESLLSNEWTCMVSWGYGGR